MGAQKTGDDRPTIVKGAYEPVGKVDIAAIKARAQKPSDDGPRQISPAYTGVSATSNTSDEPKSLADRSSAFSQSERLTTMPKPKVANRFGSNASNFTGTKAPTPGVFGLQSAPANAPSAPVGAASRTFADEGGKTPAQIWAEKKARQRGLSGAGDAPPPSMTSPITSQTSGGGEWKSGYSGKSWAPVATNPTGRSGTGSIGQQRTGEEEREQEAPASPAGGISAIRDRFKGGAPMGAPVMPRSTTGDRDQSPPPPPVNNSTRPTGGVPMPGLPNRSRPDEDEEEDNSGPNIPPPPRIQRSPTPPTPERESSPVRIAMPVARSKEPEMEAPAERDPPSTIPPSMERGMAIRTGEDSRSGVGGVGLRWMRGGGGMLGPLLPSSSSSSGRDLLGRPGIGTPPVGRVELLTGGGGGDWSRSPVVDRGMTGAPIGAPPLKRSRIALIPPAGDAGASCSRSSSPVRC